MTTANSSPPLRATVSPRRTTPPSARPHVGARIGGALAEAVVEALEAVEIDHRHSDLAPVALGAGKRLAQTVAQECAVGQVGEGIVEGQTLDEVLGLFVLVASLITRMARLILPLRASSGEARPEIQPRAATLLGGLPS